MKTRLVLCLFIAIMAASCSEEGPRKKAAPTPLDLSTTGTITVSVRYAGAVPQPPELNMRSAPGCVRLHERPVLDPTITVSNGYLVNVMVSIEQGLGNRVFATPEQPVVIDQKGCIYEPRVAGAITGQPIEFRNSDPEPHNVRGKPQQAHSWNFMMSRQNSARTVRVNTPEKAIPIGCDIHPWMKGYLFVFEHPYFGVTGTDGKVVLENVPPGDYTVAAWHEKLGTQTQKVKIEPKGAAALSFTFKPE